MIEADTVDLYEEMLYARAAKGIRPVLYVSSRKDFECSVLMLLNQPQAEQHPTAARRLGQYIMRR
ncbi:MAG TPA: hypothetical protein VLU47_14615 [Blastocatellia bacterium]|nr:hypothetical protein [Blastocatellia bacterium]